MLRFVNGTGARRVFMPLVNDTPFMGLKRVERKRSCFNVRYL